MYDKSLRGDVEDILSDSHEMSKLGIGSPTVVLLAIIAVFLKRIWWDMIKL